MGRDVSTGVGFGASAVQTATIASGQTGSNVLDFGRGYAFYAVVCEDAANIAAATNLKARVAYDDTGVPVPLYEQNDPATEWSKGAIPATGSFGFLLVHAAMAQKLQLYTTVATDGAVSFKVYGFDPTAD